MKGQSSQHWYFARSRSREIQVNPRDPTKFTKTKITARFGRNFIKYMSVQHIWNLFQLLGLFTGRKLANLSWNLVTERCKQSPETTGVADLYVAKKWVLAMTFSLPLVHFWSVLLLKEQTMTSVRKTLKCWSDQRKTDWFLAKFALKITTKSTVFYRLLFGEVCPKNSGKITAKSADFSANLSLKIPRNLTFSSATCQKPCLWLTDLLEYKFIVWFKW